MAFGGRGWIRFLSEKAGHGSDCHRQSFTTVPSNPPDKIETDTTNAVSVSMVEEGGFEPPKLQATDLQSAPFGHSGTLPHYKIMVKMELAMGLEPATC